MLCWRMTLESDALLEKGTDSCCFVGEWHWRVMLCCRMTLESDALLQNDTGE